ncbi:MAG: zinc ribbon domain-containing protein [Methanobacteriota archaeon]|nr:MAG: zinc ribbon domain-containing protein [Euryarchaeota archaeon]
MPLFEYRCKECGAKFETLVFSSHSNEPVKCENCGSEQTEKLMSTFASSGTEKSSGGGSSCSSSGGYFT